MVGLCVSQNFPGGSDHKESAFNAGDLGSDPGLERQDWSLVRKWRYCCSQPFGWCSMTVHSFFFFFYSIHFKKQTTGKDSATSHLVMVQKWSLICCLQSFASIMMGDAWIMSVFLERRCYYYLLLFIFFSIICYRHFPAF